VEKRSGPVKSGRGLILGRLQRQIELCLAEAGIPWPDRESELILCHYLGLQRSGLILERDRLLTPAQLDRIRSAVQRRLAREPLQYILGRVEFWGLEFLVNPTVLIPRPDTEFVCEQAVSTLRGERGHLRLLDMGTGAGVLAVVLARELDATVVAVDSDPSALCTAVINFRRHHLQGRIQPVASDLFAGLDRGARFDAVISNPPYVGEEERSELDPEVRDHEPARALYAGPGGLECYRRLIPESRHYLRSGGWLFLEIGWQQGEAVTGLMACSGFRGIEIRKDYGGRPRFVQGRLS